MANTLTGLIATIYRAMDVISRELTGFIPAVTLFPGAEQVAKDQTISYPIVPSYSAADIVAAATGPDPADSTISPDTMTISKARSVTFYWTGEEQVGLANLYDVILRDQFAQAMRTLCNEVELDLAALYNKASRAYGTAGTAPFNTAGDYTDASNLRKILIDNGAPGSDLQMVINTAAGANMRGKQFKANETGDVTMLRQGVLLDVHGFAIRESAQVKNHVNGTGANYLVNNVSGYPIGSTVIAVDTGTGTIIAGDIFTDSQSGRDPNNKYVVNTALSGGSLALNKPGNQVAWVDNDSVAVGSNYAANMAFARSAIHLVTRIPAMPAGGDAADDVTTVTDPNSGLTFQVAMYRQRRRVAYEIGLAWGVKAVKSEHIAILLG